MRRDPCVGSVSYCSQLQLPRVGGTGGGGGTVSQVSHSTGGEVGGQVSGQQVTTPHSLRHTGA